MFIELHGLDGKRFTLNLSQVEQFLEYDDEKAGVILVGVRHAVAVEESYRDICRALPAILYPNEYRESMQDKIDAVTKGVVNIRHTCFSCGHTWTGYSNQCPKCGTLDVPF